jgi:predicted O-methyltransferase YrrM
MRITTYELLEDKAEHARQTFDAVGVRDGLLRLQQGDAMGKAVKIGIQHE